MPRDAALGGPSREMTTRYRPAQARPGMRYTRTMATPKHADIDAYLAVQPEPARQTLQQVRDHVHCLVPAVTEYISYGCPAFALGGVRFGGLNRLTRHNSSLPHSGEVLPVLAEEGLLEGFTWAPGALHFPHDQPLSADLLVRLIETRLGWVLSER